MAYLDRLADELNNDPLSRGYAGMTDREAAADLNTSYRSEELETLTGAEIYEQVDIDEFQGLATDNQRAEVWNITHLGEAIFIGSGTKARTRFVNLFGGSSLTVQNLLAYITTPISRAAELGFPEVKAGDVEKARAL